MSMPATAGRGRLAARTQAPHGTRRRRASLCTDQGVGVSDDTPLDKTGAGLKLKTFTHEVAGVQPAELRVHRQVREGAYGVEVGELV